MLGLNVYMLRFVAFGYLLPIPRHFYHISPSVLFVILRNKGFTMTKLPYCQDVIWLRVTDICEDTGKVSLRKRESSEREFSILNDIGMRFFVALRLWDGSAIVQQYDRGALVSTVVGEDIPAVV